MISSVQNSILFFYIYVLKYLPIMLTFIILSIINKPIKIIDYLTYTIMGYQLLGMSSELEVS